MKNKLMLLCRSLMEISWLITTFCMIFVFSAPIYSQWAFTNFPSSYDIKAITFDRENLLAATDGDGIYISSDNGDNWQKRSDGLQSQIVNTLLINDGYLFAGTALGISISTNRGNSWEAVYSTQPDQPVLSFAVGNNSRIFAGIWNHIYYSDDNKNWSQIETNEITMPVISIIVHDNNIYAATHAGGFLKSSDNGNSWFSVSSWITEMSSANRLEAINLLYSFNGNLIFSGAYVGNLYSVTFVPIPPSPIIRKVIKSGHIFSLTERNNVLFAGSREGLVYELEPIDLLSKEYRTLSDTLFNRSINSLAVNESFIFAATDSGIWRLYYPEQTTDISLKKEIPSEFKLEQNYPNPFNPETTIRFELPIESYISLIIYDLLGKEKEVLVSSRLNNGVYEYKWNGSESPSGIYFCRLKTESYSKIIKMMLIK